VESFTNQQFIKILRSEWKVQHGAIPTS